MCFFNVEINLGSANFQTGSPGSERKMDGTR